MTSYVTPEAVVKVDRRIRWPGASPGQEMWGGQTWRARRAQPYNALGGEGGGAPSGVQSRAPGQGSGATPPEAENLLAFAAQRKQQIFFILQAPNHDRPQPPPRE